MPSVDKRVVQMDFQNAQFQKGVSETLGSLKSLTEEIKNTEKFLGAMKVVRRLRIAKRR